MSKAAEFDVGYVAELARLHLSDEEKQLFQKQLGEVLEHVKKLAEVDVTGVEPATHAVPVFDVFRADEAQPGLTSEEALGNAPRKRNNLFIVPKVME